MINRAYCFQLYRRLLSVCLVVAVLVLLPGLIYAAPEQGGGYLQYQEPKPVGASWLSSVGYLVTLLLTFAVVIALAYFTSRFIGYKMGGMAKNVNSQILWTLPLGANRAVYVVEIVGRLMVLGVTDHSIQLLQEITDPQEISQLKSTQATRLGHPFEKVFQSQLSSLQQMSKSFSGVFERHQKNSSNDSGNEEEKR